ACAQDVATQVDPAPLAKVDPALQPCLAELVGLTITVPEGFAENQHLVHPEGATDDPDLVLCSFVDEATGQFLSVSAHTYFDADQQAAWQRGDEFALSTGPTLMLTSAPIPSLNVDITSAYSMSFADGQAHGMMVLGCADGRCYKLEVSGSPASDRDAFIDVLRGVRFEG
ncbi:MAG: hypothetical protein AAGN64_12855, partial [Bacteroidota bacterium]